MRRTVASEYERCGPSLIQLYPLLPLSMASSMASVSTMAPRAVLTMMTLSFILANSATVMMSIG